MTGLNHPYSNLTSGTWSKGNLHAHTTRSDGYGTPQAVLDDYADRGYAFLMFSDHDIFTSSDDCQHLDNGNLILVPGNEITANGPHLLHVGASSRLSPHASRQVVLGQIQRDDGFGVFTHPNYGATFDHCPQQALNDCRGYRGLEIYNGGIGRVEGSPYALDRWDLLLSQGRHVWGFANDDAHAAQDVGLGWNVAYLREHSLQGVLEALIQGRFYASTGVEITGIRVDGKRIVVETANAERIVALRENGVRFSHADDVFIETEFPADATYVRFECWGQGETFAWTQPFFPSAE